GRRAVTAAPTPSSRARRAAVRRAERSATGKLRNDAVNATADGRDCRSAAAAVRGRGLRHPVCSTIPLETEGPQMNDCKVAVFVGSLRQDSYNRRLARAVEKLAPQTMTFDYVRIDDLPLYTQDFDADSPANAQRLKLAFAPLGQELVRRQARGDHRHVDRRDRHRHRAAAPADLARLPRRAHARAAGGLPAFPERPDRARRHGVERLDPPVPAGVRGYVCEMGRAFRPLTGEEKGEGTRGKQRGMRANKPALPLLPSPFSLLFLYGLAIRQASLNPSPV